jgi:spore maturation protein CgeB
MRRLSPSDVDRRWDLSYLGTYSPDRQPMLERLLLEPARRAPNLRFVVAGPQYPSDIAWPANVERMEHVPPSDHPAFYSASRYTLNVTRADMVAAGFSPSVRLFEAAACGTPVIADEVVAILSGEDDEARFEMAKGARELVLASHTGAARAREFVALLGSPAATAADLDIGSAA